MNSDVVNNFKTQEGFFSGPGTDFAGQTTTTTNGFAKQNNFMSRPMTEGGSGHLRKFGNV